MNDITYNIREGQLVQLYHDRPQASCFINGHIIDCLLLLGFTREGGAGDIDALVYDDYVRDLQMLVSATDPNHTLANGAPIMIGVYSTVTGMSHLFAHSSDESEYSAADYDTALQDIIDWLGVGANMGAAG